MERIKLNLIPSGVAPIVHLSQYDDGRQFGIDLFEGESVYVLDGTETLTVNSRKPDGHVVTLSVTNTGTSSLDVDTIEQLTAVHGVSYAKLQIEKGAVTIATLPFLIDVSRDPLENGDPSESFVHNLRTQIADGVAEEVAEQYDSANVIFDNEPTDNHGIGYTVTSEGIKTAIDNAFDYDNTASGSLVHITDGADNIPVKSLTSEIVAVESGSGEKSPTNPYTISGFANGVVSVCGKNLLKNGLTSQTYNGITFTVNSDGTITLSGTATAEIYRTFHIYLPKGSYIFSSGVTESFSSYDTYIAKDGTTIARGNSVAPGSTFTLTEYSDLVLNIRIRNGVSPNTTLKLMIRVASDTDDTFVPYNGNTYTFTFGQTVYGGHFDNKSNLVVTHGTVDLSSLTWTYQSAATRFVTSGISATVKAPQTNNDVANVISSILQTTYANNTSVDGLDNSVGITTTGNIVIKCTSAGTTPSDLVTLLSGSFFVYELATPITLSITSQNIPTLLGENNIFSDCGDVEVTYYTSKSNDILDFIDSEIGKKNGTNIPIEENSLDSIKDYIDNVSLSGLSDTDISGESVGQVLTFDGDNWVNSSSLSDKIDEFSTWKTSTISFSKACESLGIYSGMGAVLDNLETNVGGYSDQSLNNRVDASQGPVYFMLVGKANNSYYTGILMSYFYNDTSRQPIMFTYSNGTYAVKRI